MRLGAVIVGVNNYEAPGSAALASLRYSERDAHAVHEFLAVLSSDPSNLFKLIGSRATRAAFDEAIAQLAERGRFDLVVIYLSGHGKHEEGGRGAFVFPSDPADVGMLWPEELDSLLKRIPASQVLLFLDCCHAEALLHGLTFFSSLGESSARLFICSSRGDQPTWEEQGVKHGVFTAFLLDALNTDSLGHGRREVDIQHELFPYLCEQVPLYVYQHKGGALQEPVGGGISRAPLRLPLARGERGGKASTPLRTVIRRLRQIGLAGLVGSIAALILIYMMVYFVAVDPYGHIVLKRGIRELEPVLGWLPLTKLQSSITQEQLAPETASTILGGTVVGIWSQRSQLGYRLWVDRLAPFLEPPWRERMLLETTGTPPSSQVASDPTNSRAWRARLFADAMSIQPARIDEYGTWLRRSLPADDAGDGAYDPRHFNFNVLDLAPHAIGNYLAALRTYAAISPDQAFGSFVQMLKVVRHRMDYGDDQRRALAAVLQALVWSRAGDGREGVSNAELALLEDMGKQGYGPCVWPVLATSGGAYDLTRIRAELLATVATYDRSRQGALLNDEQCLALESLAGSVREGSTHDAIADMVFGMFADRFDWPDAAPLQSFLSEVGSRTPLSKTTKARLIARGVASMSRDHDYEHVSIARVLAANARFLTLDELALLRDLVKTIEEELPSFSGDLGGIYGHLITYSLGTDAMRKSIEDHVPKSRADREDLFDGAEPVGASIRPDRESWGMALARVGQRLPLTPQEAETLRAWALVADEPLGRFYAVRALVHQIDFVSTGTPTAAWMRQRLSDHRPSAAGRELETEVLAAWLAALPPTQRRGLLEEFRALYHGEIEVEVRLAMAQVIENAIEHRAPFHLCRVGS